MVNFAHFIWFQGIDKTPQKYKNSISKFKEYNPEFQIYIWSEIELKELLNSTHEPIFNDFKILSMKRLEEVNCDSIMIGHIHTPAIEKIGEKNYYNTGDFCESCSFLYEDLSGDIKLVILD